MSSVSPVLIVGLGNPGPEYASTRHNIGWLVLERLAREAGAPAFKSKFQGELAKGTLGGRDSMLLMPQTFMNESGRSVQPAAAFFHVAPRDVIVLHDELDLPFADVRVKLGGGHAGHNGLRSIIQHLGTPDFARVRMGIGRPPSTFTGDVGGAEGARRVTQDVAGFVLSGFTAKERVLVPEMVELGAKAVLQILTLGLERAMKASNTRPKPAPPPRDPDPKKEGN